jgi:hypothetical protein
MTKAKAKLDLSIQLAAQLVDHHVGPQTTYTKETNIVTARNGIFRVIKTPVAILKTQIAKMEKDIVVPGAAEMTEGAELLVPKIPFKYWLMVLKYYRDIHKKDGTEASVLYFWNTHNHPVPSHYNASDEDVKAGRTEGAPIKGLTEDGQLIIYCPIQKNSSGLSEFHTDGMVNWLRTHTTPLLETHSHHTMGAFFSGTDDANENMNQFYAVYGTITKENPAFIFRYCSGPHKVVYDPSVLFDFPQVRITTETRAEFIGSEGAEIEGFAPVTQEKVVHEKYEGPWPDVDYPADWMEQHSKSHVAPIRSYSSGAYAAGGYGAAKQDYKSGAPHGTNRNDQYYDDIEGYAYGGYPLYGGGNWYDDQGTLPLAGRTHGSEAPLKKNEQEDEESSYETGTSYVEIQAQEIISNMTRDQIKQLIQEMSDYGYDHLIGEALAESKDMH